MTARGKKTTITTKDARQRFNNFLRDAAPGTHFFRGNLHECYVDGLVDTRGRQVTATEVECARMVNIINRVHVQESDGSKNDHKFYLDERCF